MTIGLCGSHRVGKTTLAEEFSKLTDIPFVRTSTSDVFRRYGVDPAKPMPIALRFEIQNAILDEASKVWQSSPSPIFITDRTPIDMAGYMLAEIVPNVDGHGEDEHLQLKRYIERCLISCNLYFSSLVLIQPGIPLTDDPNKLTGFMSKSYMEHLNYLMYGILMDLRLTSFRFAMHRDLTDLSGRINFLNNKILYAATNSESAYSTKRVH